MVERWLDGYDGLKEVERAAGEFMEGTREKELSELERLLVGEERQRVVVVQGPFGIGKSCLLAQLCAKGGLLKEHRASGWLRNSLLRPLSERKKGRLVVGAAHFFLLSDDDAEKSKSLSVCLYSIAHQLCSIVSGLREELEKIQDELETVDDLKTLFRKVLVTPLQRVNKMDGVVVVLDGMENIGKLEAGELMKFIVCLWEREMPEWTSLVLSLRAASFQLWSLLLGPVKTINMEYESESNEKDMYTYLKKRLKTIVVGEEQDLNESIKLIQSRAKGNFLYACDVIQVALREELHSLEWVDVQKFMDEVEKELGTFQRPSEMLGETMLSAVINSDLQKFTDGIEELGSFQRPKGELEEMMAAARCEWDLRAIQQKLKDYNDGNAERKKDVLNRIASLVHNSLNRNFKMHLDESYQDDFVEELSDAELLTLEDVLASCRVIWLRSFA